MTRIEQILRAGIDNALHLGAQAYVSRAGNTLLHTAVGELRPGVPLDVEARMLWMSAGKPLTAIAVMQLVERGLLGLDDAVAGHIPPFAAGGKLGVTVRHLLLHTGGFRGPLNNFTPGTWDQIVRRCCDLRQEPGWVAGQKAGYHVASSWFILAELVRRLDGRPIDAYVDREVFARVGATGASIGSTQEAMHDPRWAPMFGCETGPLSDRWVGNAVASNTLPRPGANARGPIRALARVYESLLLDERLLRRETIAEMVARQRGGMFDHTFGQVLDWGLGFLLDSTAYAGEHAYGYGPHVSPSTFGHSGNQCGCAFADPDTGLVVAWVCNGMPGEPRHQDRARQINTELTTPT